MKAFCCHLSRASALVYLIFICCHFQQAVFYFFPLAFFCSLLSTSSSDLLCCEEVCQAQEISKGIQKSLLVSLGYRAGSIQDQAPDGLFVQQFTEGARSEITELPSSDSPEVSTFHVTSLPNYAKCSFPLFKAGCFTSSRGP